MKRKDILIGILIIVSLHSTAQDYIPMVKDSTVYNITNVNFAINPWDSDSYSTKSIGIFGDTVINTVTYKKVYELDCLRDSVILLPERYKGAIREDIELQQVWFYKNDIEYLLYDFSLSVDDYVTINSEFCGGPVQLRVTNISTVEIDGIERRKFEMYPTELTGWCGDWIEGIGSSAHLFDYIYPHGNFDVYLSCYFENEQLVYSPWGECCEGETNIESKLSNKFTISPNPASAEVNFEFEDDLSRTIIIYNADSKTVDKFEINSCFYIYNSSNLRSGIYFIRIFEGKTSYIQKLVII